MSYIINLFSTMCFQIYVVYFALQTSSSEARRGSRYISLKMWPARRASSASKCTRSMLTCAKWKTFGRRTAFARLLSLCRTVGFFLFYTLKIVFYKLINGIKIPENLNWNLICFFKNVPWLQCRCIVVLTFGKVPFPLSCCLSLNLSLKLKS